MIPHTFAFFSTSHLTSCFLTYFFTNITFSLFSFQSPLLVMSYWIFPHRFRNMCVCTDAIIGIPRNFWVRHWVFYQISSCDYSSGLKKRYLDIIWYFLLQMCIYNCAIICILKNIYFDVVLLYILIYTIHHSHIITTYRQLLLFYSRSSRYLIHWKNFMVIREYFDNTFQVKLKVSIFLLSK